jgi:hypothetical protein
MDGGWCPRFKNGTEAVFEQRKRLQWNAYGGNAVSIGTESAVSAASQYSGAGGHAP